jgi:hypothetical protein
MVKALGLIKITEQGRLFLKDFDPEVDLAQRLYILSTSALFEEPVPLTDSLRSMLYTIRVTQYVCEKSPKM